MRSVLGRLQAAAIVIAFPLVVGLASTGCGRIELGSNLGDGDSDSDAGSGDAGLAPAHPLGCDAPVLETGFASTSANGNAEMNALVALKITLKSDATLRGATLSIVSTSDAPQAIFGVYRDQAGAPGGLVAQSATITLPASGTAEAVFHPTRVPAGDYWLASVFSASTTGIRVNLAAGPTQYIRAPYSFVAASHPEGLAATFPSNKIDTTAEGYALQLRYSSAELNPACAKSPPPPPTQPLVLGGGGATLAIGADTFYGFPFTITADTVLRRISADVRSAVSIRYAVYEEQPQTGTGTGGIPNKLVAQSEVVVGAAHAATNPALLKAGNYWVGIVAAASTTLGADAATSLRWSTPYAFSTVSSTPSAFPLSFPPSTGDTKVTPTLTLDVSNP